MLGVRKKKFVLVTLVFTKKRKSVPKRKIFFRKKPQKLFSPPSPLFVDLIDCTSILCEHFIEEERARSTHLRDIFFLFVRDNTRALVYTKFVDTFARIGDLKKRGNRLRHTSFYKKKDACKKGRRRRRT
jgi:hypothetical protein